MSISKCVRTLCRCYKFGDRLGKGSSRKQHGVRITIITDETRPPFTSAWRLLLPRSRALLNRSRPDPPYPYRVLGQSREPAFRADDTS